MHALYKVDNCVFLGHACVTHNSTNSPVAFCFFTSQALQLPAFCLELSLHTNPRLNNILNEPCVC